MPDTRAGRNEQKSDRVNLNTGITYFLGIGIDEYQHWPRLRNAVRDVHSISELLISDYGVTPEHSYTLFDQQASRAAIIELLEDLAKRVKPTDSLIVYYAGHGHLNDRKRGYWVPADAPKDGISYYISNSTIRDYLGDIPSLHTLLISDSCFSGSLFVRGERSGDLAAHELSKLSSRWAICSGRHDEVVADGPEDGHSPFAESILDVLKHTDRPHITTNFLFEQVRDQTRANYDQLPDGGPIQGVGHKRGQFIFRRTKTEAEAWAEAQQKNTAEAFRYYLSLFPAGAHQKDAEAKLVSIAGNQAWALLQQLPTAQLLEVETALQRVRHYCQDYPNHQHFAKALALGRRLEQKQNFLEVYDSEFGLMAFVREDTPFREEAQKRLAALQAGTRTSSPPPPKAPPEPPPQAPPQPELTTTPPPPKVEKKPPPTTQSGAGTKRSPQTPQPAVKRSWVIGGLLGIVMLLALVWGINRCTRSNSNNKVSATSTAATIEKEVYRGMRTRNAAQVKKGVELYKNLPDEVTNDKLLNLAEQWMISYQDSLDALKQSDTNSNSPNPVTSTGQENQFRRASDHNRDDDSVLSVVDETPRFPGCEGKNLSKEKLEACSKEALKDYIIKHLKYPEEAQAKGVKGLVLVGAIIGVEGKVEDARILQSLSNDCDEAALQVFNKMREDGVKWTPGLRRGKPVPTRVAVPVRFQL